MLTLNGIVAVLVVCLASCMAAATERPAFLSNTTATGSQSTLLDQLRNTSMGDFKQPRLPASLRDATVPHAFTYDERAAIRARLRTLALGMQLFQAAAAGMTEEQRQYNEAQAVWPVVSAMIEAEREACEPSDL